MPDPNDELDAIGATVKRLVRSVNDMDTDINHLDDQLTLTDVVLSTNIREHSYDIDELYGFVHQIVNLIERIAQMERQRLDYAKAQQRLLREIVSEFKELQTRPAATWS